MSGNIDRPVSEGEALFGQVAQQVGRFYRIASAELNDIDWFFLDMEQLNNMRGAVLKYFQFTISQIVFRRLHNPLEYLVPDPVIKIFWIQSL